MLKFDSNEYWQKTTWDRYTELDVVPLDVKNEFLLQEKLTVSYISELTKKNKNTKILDLACGTGKISESIIRSSLNNVTLTVADFNKNTLEKTKRNLEKYNNINYLLIDALKIGEYFKGEFDVIVCMDFFHHISNLSVLIKQINTSLRSEGILIANAFDKNNYKKWDRMKYGCSKSLKRRFLFEFANIIYPYTTTNIKRIINKNGWARISPLTEIDIVNNLSPYFVDIEFKKSFYLWFNAKKRA